MGSLHTSRGDTGRFQNSNYFNGVQRSVPATRSPKWERVDKRLLNFIWAHNEWVDQEILERLNIGDATVVNEALNQIHLRSLNEREYQQGGSFRSGRNYSEVLTDHRTHQGEWKPKKRRFGSCLTRVGRYQTSFYRGGETLMGKGMGFFFF